jgi:hypothetical protein
MKPTVIPWFTYFWTFSEKKNCRYFLLRYESWVWITDQVILLILTCLFCKSHFYLSPYRLSKMSHIKRKIHKLVGKGSEYSELQCKGQQYTYILYIYSKVNNNLTCICYFASAIHISGSMKVIFVFPWYVFVAFCFFYSVVFFIRYHFLSEYGGAKGREGRKKLYNVHVSAWDKIHK